MTKEEEETMHTRSQKKAKLAARIVTYFVLIAAAVICLFPFIWMISTSFKPMSDIYKMPPTLFPENGTVENLDRKSTRLNSSHNGRSRMPSSA